MRAYNHNCGEGFRGKNNKITKHTHNPKEGHKNTRLYKK